MTNPTGDMSLYVEKPNKAIEAVPELVKLNKVTKKKYLKHICFYQDQKGKNEIKTGHL